MAFARENKELNQLTTVLNFIGRGGFGDVYGPCAWKNRTCAVKKRMFGTTEDSEKEQEACKMWMTLHHKNLVTVYDVSSDPPALYIVMEYGRGGTLDKVLKMCTSALPVQILTDWSIQIARGMSYLHEVNLVHRDLKSANIIIMEPDAAIDPYGKTLKIIDFDQIREFDHTTIMSMAGSCAWMAPEVLEYGYFSKANDVWSYGVVLWEMTAREVPYKGLSSHAIMIVAIERNEANWLAVPDLCPDIIRIVLESCLSFERRGRPTFDHILSTLEPSQSQRGKMSKEGKVRVSNESLTNVSLRSVKEMETDATSKDIMEKLIKSLDRTMIPSSSVLNDDSTLYDRCANKPAHDTVFGKMKHLFSKSGRTKNKTAILAEAHLSNKSNDAVERHREFLEEHMEPDFGLLEKLLSNKTLSRKDISKVMAESTVYKRNSKLLDYIVNKHRDDRLIDALQDAEQMHIVNYLNGNGEYNQIYGEEWPLKQREISILDDNRERLIELLDLNILLHLLYSSGIINRRQMNFISTKPNSDNKNEALLDILRRCSLRVYLQAICCLRQSNQTHIADIFESGGGVASHTVEVSNIPPNVTGDMLSLYFELKGRSGGGPIKNFQMNPDKRQAWIRFESVDDAAEVAKRQTHRLLGVTFDVVLLESDPVEGSGGCRAIRVSGIDRHKLSFDHISMFFENASKEDNIPDLFLDQDVAVITFSTPEAVQRVLSKEIHVLENIQLHVEAMTPCSPPPFYAGETERERLIIKGLPFGITLSKLNVFLECEAGCRVTGWVLGLKKNSAMLEFEREPDYAALQRLVNTVPFSGRMVRIQRVPLTTCIHVDDLLDKDSDDSIVTYFEEKAGANRGTIRFDRMTKNSVVLKFLSHSAMTSVLSEHHVLNGHSLTLSPFSKELGCVLPNKLPKEPLDNWIPKSTEVVGSEEQLQYIQNNLQIRERVQQTIKDVNCVISFPSDAGTTVKLEQIARGSESENQVWSELCSGTFSSLLGDIVTRKLVATPEVLRRLKVQVEKETSEVDVKLDEGSSEIHFTGFTDSIATFEKKLMALKNEVERQLKEEEEKKRRNVEVLTTLRPRQISYIQQCGVAEDVSKRFTNINLSVDEQTVQLEGAEETLTDVKIFIYDIISQIEPRFVNLSQDLTEFITIDPTKTYVDDYLKRYGIRAIIEAPPPGKIGVTVYAIGQEEIQRASSFLTTHFVSVHLELNDAARHAMLSPDWEVLVGSLKQHYRFFRLHASSDVLVVSGQKDLTERISIKILELFENTVTVKNDFKKQLKERSEIKNCILM